MFTSRTQTSVCMCVFPSPFVRALPRGRGPVPVTKDFFFFFFLNYKGGAFRDQNGYTLGDSLLRLQGAPAARIRLHGVENNGNSALYELCHTHTHTPIYTHVHIYIIIIQTHTYILYTCVYTSATVIIL